MTPNLIPDAAFLCDDDWALLVESKVGAPLDTAQLERYLKEAAKRVGEGHAWVLSITPRLADGDRVSRLRGRYIVHLRWQELYRFMEGLNLPPEGSILREKLLELMEERGLQPLELRLARKGCMENAAAEVLQLRKGVDAFLNRVVSHVLSQGDGVGETLYGPAESERDWERWLLQDRRGLRRKFRVTKTVSHYDSHVRFDPYERKVEYLVYLILRSDWTAAPRGPSTPVGWNPRE